MDILKRIEDADNLKFFTPNQLGEFLEMVGSDFKLLKNNKKISYYNIPCAFDIETTSFYENGEERAIMYEWSLSINWVVMIGRTWEEFENIIEGLAEWADTDNDTRLIIYVHNLSYEFQFMRKHLNIEKVFALKERKVAQLITNEGIEFRCSYILSGYSLANLSNQLVKYKVSKKVGDLDYKLPRTPLTPLTEKELGYCINDVIVVTAYIQEIIERDGNITKIPLTKTGYVRNHCRNACLYGDKTHRKNTDKYHKYRKLMKSLTLEVEEYCMLKQAFMGGFTHASAPFSRGTFHNVGSFDETSAYPAVMLSEKFPMSKGKQLKIETEEQFKNCLINYCCLFEVIFEFIEEDFGYEHYIPVSKCQKLYSQKDENGEEWNVVEDNGRVVKAGYVRMTITEQDYFIIRRFYKWKVLKVGKFIAYEKEYLPTEFVKSILDLYIKKTELKDVKGKEVEYMQSKERVNSAYGMCVTDILRDEITYSLDEWGKETPDIEDAISKYNKSKRRFLSYAWGVWVTAYARYNLMSCIVEFGEDYIYSDTDSVKGQNVEKHQWYIDRYNEYMITKLERAFDFHGIPRELIRPKNNKGEEKILGTWEDEGIYTRFRTLGAKRYMTEKPNRLGELELSITVSGVNKKKAVPYLKEKYGDKVFENFDNNLYIPAEYTGNMLLTYIDFETSGILVDYLGKQYQYHELSSTHMRDREYSLSLSEKYIDYLMGIVEERY